MINYKGLLFLFLIILSYQTLMCVRSAGFNVYLATKLGFSVYQNRKVMSSQPAATCYLPSAPLFLSHSIFFESPLSS